MPSIEISINGASIKLEATETSIQQLGEQAIELLTQANELDRHNRLYGAVGFRDERRWTPTTETPINTTAQEGP